MAPTRSLVLFLIAAFQLCTSASRLDADLTLCTPAQPITHQINVNMVQTLRDDGTDPSSIGNRRIYGMVDAIFAQLGIDVVFHVGPTWNNTFAHQGSNGLGTRAAGDFFTILNDASAAGKNAASASTINMFFVDVTPSFPPLGNANAAGIASVGGNGIAMFVGSDVGLFSPSEESAATIMAHQIGHNLGLLHSTDSNNLMTAVVSGQCFNTAQAQEILANKRGFLTPVLACDLNGDGIADAADAGIMFGNWGNSGIGDCNHDGIVDAADAGLLFAEWTGDPAPVTLPEPAGGAWLALLMTFALSRKPYRASVGVIAKKRAQ